MFRVAWRYLVNRRARGGPNPLAFRPAVEALRDRLAPSAVIAASPESPPDTVRQARFLEAAGPAAEAVGVRSLPPKKAPAAFPGDAGSPVALRVRPNTLVTVSPSVAPGSFVASVNQANLDGYFRVANHTNFALTVKVRCGTTTDTFPLDEGATLNFRPPAGTAFCTVTITRSDPALR